MDEADVLPPASWSASGSGSAAGRPCSSRRTWNAKSSISSWKARSGASSPARKANSLRVSLSSRIPWSGRSWCPAWRWWGWSEAPPWTRSSLVLSSGHSRLPVFEGDIDHIKGILLAKDLLVFWQTPEETWDLARSCAPPISFPESKKISDLLRDLVERKTQIAVVIDEYGGTAGLITLEDILEEIVGEIYDEYDRLEPRLVPQEDGSVLVDARLDVEELMEHFGLPRPEGKFESVGGLLIHVLGRVPQVNDQVEIDNLELTVVSADERRAKQVRARTTLAAEGGEA